MLMKRLDVIDVILKTEVLGSNSFWMKDLFIEYFFDQQTKNLGKEMYLGGCNWGLELGRLVEWVVTSCEWSSVYGMIVCCVCCLRFINRGTLKIIVIECSIEKDSFQQNILFLRSNTLQYSVRCSTANVSLLLSRIWVFLLRNTTED